jgi:hypothetical protein
VDQTPTPGSVAQWNTTSGGKAGFGQRGLRRQGKFRRIVHEEPDRGGNLPFH